MFTFFHFVKNLISNLYRSHGHFLKKMIMIEMYILTKRVLCWVGGSRGVEWVRGSWAERLGELSCLV